MAEKDAFKALVAKFVAERGKYELGLESRDLYDVAREFKMLLVKLDAGIPEGAPDNIAAQIVADHNNNIDEFIEYLKARKY